MSTRRRRLDGFPVSAVQGEGTNETERARRPVHASQVDAVYGNGPALDVDLNSACDFGL